MAKKKKLKTFQVEQVKGKNGLYKIQTETDVGKEVRSLQEIHEILSKPVPDTENDSTAEMT